MAEIRCIYAQEPSFPATDQHPQATRHFISGVWVDAIGTPTQAEVDTVLAPPTAAQRIDIAFPQTDTAQVIFEAFFEIANRLQALEGKQPVTRAQLKSWLQAKLPP